jgi:hypothetical protein
VAGLKAAGPNFDRQKVIDAINSMKAWDADGMIAPVDWTTRHTRRNVRDDPQLGVRRELLQAG